MYMKEIWKIIKNYEDYQVSDLGNVKSKMKSNKNLSKSNRGKYYAVNLYKNNKRKTFNIHRLVAQAFISNPENKSCVNHIDCNTFNNNLSNLEWVTHRENIMYAYSLGRKENKTGEKSSNVKLKDIDIVKIKKLYSMGEKIKNIVPLFNVSQATISRVILNKQRKPLTA